MGMRIVRISGELFDDLLTEGHTFPNREGQILRVVKGLPEGAKLVGISHDLFFYFNEWSLKYEHPSWPDQPAGTPIPVLPIELTLENPLPAAFVTSALTPRDVERTIGYKKPCPDCGPML